MAQREYNFDGLVGPTHNYAGLSVGNLASLAHEGQVSSPRRAALQGLEKMRFVASLGVGQAVLPPQPRPSLRTLRALGFTGKDEAVVRHAATEAEALLRLVSSAAAMWTANAATVAPSEDSADKKMHLTPANLAAMFHRSLEADTTFAVLGRIFEDARHFSVHAPLPGGAHLADEGAANHTRLAVPGRPAVHLFAWGRSSFRPSTVPVRFPARQTQEASEALARLHALAPGACLFPQQAPAGIDAGAFHTDVLAVGNDSFLMLHALAFLETEALLHTLKTKLGSSFQYVLADENELPATDAVQAYPFNSQVLTLPGGGMCIVAPKESEERPKARAFLERVLAEDNPVQAVHYLDVRESMNNGGGPACLRLRVRLTDEERAAVRARVFYDEALHADLEAWVRRHYRERLAPDDLRDPALAKESMAALDALTGLLRLGSVYDFQKA
jgi:succinylarginine dihydrolase